MVQSPQHPPCFSSFPCFFFYGFSVGSMLLAPSTGRDWVCVVRSGAFAAPPPLVLSPLDPSPSFSCALYVSRALGAIDQGGTKGRGCRSACPLAPLAPLCLKAGRRSCIPCQSLPSLPVISHGGRAACERLPCMPPSDGLEPSLLQLTPDPHPHPTALAPPQQPPPHMAPPHLNPNATDTLA